MLKKHTHARTHAWLGTRATDECGYIQSRRGITINTHSLRDALNSDQTHVRRVCQSTLPVIYQIDYYLTNRERPRHLRFGRTSASFALRNINSNFVLMDFSPFKQRPPDASMFAANPRVCDRHPVLDCSSIDLLNLSASRALPLA